MDCDETRDLLHGYLDGELDVVSSRALTQHLQACSACTQAYEAQRVLRTALQTSALYFTPPPSLHKQIRAAVRRASRTDTRPLWWTWGGLSVAVAMATIVLLVWSSGLMHMHPKADEQVLQDVIAGTYYARCKVDGKPVRESLETQAFTVAKLRLPDKLEDLEAQSGSRHLRRWTAEIRS